MIRDRLCPLKGCKVGKEPADSDPCRLDRGDLFCDPISCGLRFRLLIEVRGECYKPLIPGAGNDPGLPREDVEFGPPGKRQVGGGHEGDDVRTPVAAGRGGEDREERLDERRCGERPAHGDGAGNPKVGEDLVDVGRRPVEIGERDGDIARPDAGGGKIADLLRYRPDFVEPVPPFCDADEPSIVPGRAAGEEAGDR
ncbi:MAG: hypothetical protein BWX50_01607 [Euryarchaeota archaeon ADurb.Bin009]|nr:MAG: hypothetical protein BWX50_01607 [Euryarchaeota archaeon ADurb.Bin009]